MPIIFADRKKIQAIATGGSNVELKNEEELDLDMQVLQALAKDAMDAIESGSSSDFARAMKAFFYQCKAMPKK